MHVALRDISAIAASFAANSLNRQERRETENGAGVVALQCIYMVTMLPQLANSAHALLCDAFHLTWGVRRRLMPVRSVAAPPPSRSRAVAPSWPQHSARRPTQTARLPKVLRLPSPIRDTDRVQRASASHHCCLLILAACSSLVASRSACWCTKPVACVSTEQSLELWRHPVCRYERCDVPRDVTAVPGRRAIAGVEHPARLRGCVRHWRVPAACVKDQRRPRCKSIVR